ncbi:MAG: prepilin-type N-terminal cleavage/methylation domain-containing protein [bacterium]
MGQALAPRRPPAKSTRTAPEGFTLLEVMVAVAILGIAMTTLHYGQAQAIRAQARTENMIVATMKAMERMHEIAFLRPEELPRAGESEEGAFEPPYERFHWRVRVEENEYTPDLLNIFLTINWDTDETGRTTLSSQSQGKEGAGRSLELCFYRAATLR